MNSEPETRELWKMPSPSYSLLSGGPQFDVRLGREIALCFDFEGPQGEPVHKALVFEGVETYTCTHEGAREDWMLCAYEQLVELTNSQWPEQVMARLRKHGPVPAPLRHLVINFDLGPCYEVVCRSFRIEGDED